MNGIALLLAAATVGVDFGWQPSPDGGLEYIIQIEPVALAGLAEGHDILSQVDPYVRNVRRFRIRVGTEDPPRRGTPPEKSTPSADAAKLLDNLPGVQFGWQSIGQSELEYIVQIDANRLEALRRGEQIVGELAPQVANVTRYRVRLGNGPVPRNIAPRSVVSVADEPPAAAVQPKLAQPQQSQQDTAVVTSTARSAANSANGNNASGNSANANAASGNNAAAIAAVSPAERTDLSATANGSSTAPPAASSVTVRQSSRQGGWYADTAANYGDDRGSQYDTPAAAQNPQSSWRDPIEQPESVYGRAGWQQAATETETEQSQPFAPPSAELIAAMLQWCRENPPPGSSAWDDGWNRPQEPTSPYTAQNNGGYGYGGNINANNNHAQPGYQPPGYSPVTNLQPTFGSQQQPGWQSNQSHHVAFNSETTTIPTIGIGTELTSGGSTSPNRLVSFDAEIPSGPPKDFWTTLSAEANAPENQFLKEDGLPAGEKPWVMTVLMLMASIGGNLYLGWIATDIFRRYREMLFDRDDDLEEDRPRSRRLRDDDREDDDDI